MANAPVVGEILRWATRLQHPQLFKVVLALFALDLLIPDAIPFVDELLLGFVTLLLGTWKKSHKGAGARREDPEAVSADWREE